MVDISGTYTLVWNGFEWILVFEAGVTCSVILEFACGCGSLGPGCGGYTFSVSVFLTGTGVFCFIGNFFVFGPCECDPLSITFRFTLTGLTCCNTLETAQYEVVVSL